MCVISNKDKMSAGSWFYWAPVTTWACCQCTKCSIPFLCYLYVCCLYGCIQIYWIPVPNYLVYVLTDCAQIYMECLLISYYEVAALCNRFSTFDTLCWPAVIIYSLTTNTIVVPKVIKAMSPPVTVFEELKFILHFLLTFILSTLMAFQKTPSFSHCHSEFLKKVELWNITLVSR